MSDELTISDVAGDVQTVVQRLTADLKHRGVEVFAAIDHAAGARAVGLELPYEVLLIFGNPAVGTALLQSDLQVGIELPLRMVVWSQDGTTRVAYQDPMVLAQRYSLGGTQDTLTKLRALLEHLVTGLAINPTTG